MSATFFTAQRQQTGIVLIEALVSILIFSVGVLAIIGLLAASIASSRDSTNRSTAGLLANQVVGQMWADDRDPAKLLAKYGTGGTGYTAWINGNQFQVLPGVSGVAANQPTIAVSAVTPPGSPAPTSSLVTVTIKWQPPDAAVAHQYTSVTQIN